MVGEGRVLAQEPLGAPLVVAPKWLLVQRRRKPPLRVPALLLLAWWRWRGSVKPCTQSLFGAANMGYDPVAKETQTDKGKKQYDAADEISNRVHKHGFLLGLFGFSGHDIQCFIQQLQLQGCRLYNVGRTVLVMSLSCRCRLLNCIDDVC